MPPLLFVSNTRKSPSTTISNISFKQSASQDLKKGPKRRLGLGIESFREETKMATEHSQTPKRHIRPRRLQSLPALASLALTKPYLSSATLPAILLLLLLSASNPINCDPQAPTTTTTTLAPATSTTTTPTSSSSSSTTTTTTELTPTSTSRVSSTTQASASSSSSSLPTLIDENKTSHSVEYRQHPNPPGSEDASTKFTYDVQHENGSSSTVASLISTSTPVSVTTEAEKKASSLSGKLDSHKVPLVDQISDSLSSSPSSSYTLTPDSSSIDNHHASGGDGAEDGASSAVAGGAPVAEALITSDVPASAAVDNGESTSSQVDPMAVQASTPTSTSSVSSRVGRASPQNAYTPPSTSRLSAYTPMLLQNSRTHSRVDEESGSSSSSSDSLDSLLSDFRQPSNRQQQLQTTQLVPATTTTTTTAAPQEYRYKPDPKSPFDPIIVCYLGSWSTYRPSLSKFTPENINPFLCTHIIYAFAGLSSKFELKPFDSYNDITQGGYRKFTGLKDYNKQLKTLIAVGGWNEGSGR